MRSESGWFIHKIIVSYFSLMERVDGYSYYFVRSCELRVARTGNPFGALTLLATDGSVLCVSCWGLEVGATGAVLSLPYPLRPASNGFISFDLGDAEFFDLSREDVLTHFPEFSSEFPDLVSKSNFMATLDACFGSMCAFSSSPYHAVVRAVKDHADRVLYDAYYDAPAAKIMHHAYPGGLLVHTYEMLVMFAALADTPVYNRVNRVLCTIGILYHDFGKLVEYDDANHDPTEIMFLYPHSVYGASFVKEMYGSMLSRDDMLLLLHIILAHHGKKEWGAPCEPATLSAELVHHLDMLSARADMFLHAENMSSVQGLGGRKVVTKDINPDFGKLF